MMHSAHFPVFGPKPQAEPASPEELGVELDEVQSLAAWEFLCLLDIGFSVAECQELVAIKNFSWHSADALLKKGWPHATVVDELT